MFSERKVRTANQADVDAIVNIWKTGIKEAIGIPSDIDDEKVYEYFYKKIQEQSVPFNVWVAVHDTDDSILGWQSLSPIINSPAVHDLWAESSTYVREDTQKHGVAEALVRYAIEEARNSLLEYVVALVPIPNYHVIKLAERIGFLDLGTIQKSRKSESSQGYHFLYCVV